MKAQIAQIRQRFETELDHNCNHRFNAIDIERVRTEDWQIRRYLLDANGDLSVAYRNLIRTLEWKQSFGVHSITEEYFPTEFYQLYKVETFGRDREGRLIFTESFSRQRHYTELEECFRKLVAVWMEKMDRLAGEAGMLYLGDFTDTPLTLMDIGLAKFRVEVLNKHYPLLAQRIVLANVSFLLKPILKLIVSFMKPSIREAVVYSDTANLTDYVDATVLHEDVGGLRQQRHYPKTVSFRTCYARFSVKPAFVDYYFKYNELP